MVAPVQGSTKCSLALVMTVGMKQVTVQMIGMISELKLTSLVPQLLVQTELATFSS